MVDESFWLLSELQMKSGKFHEAIQYLDLIMENHSEDIWGDDAFFRKAEIYEKQIADSDKAQDLYRQFLEAYP